MKLIELYAEEFGCLKDRRFSFGEGVNLIEGANESGKSTLQALIRFLLYGFPRRSGEGAEERDKRLSRRTHRAAGSLIFSWHGERYFLYRDYVLHTSVGRELPAEQLRITKEDGSTVDLHGKTPGEYFLMLPVELYHASACVREAELERVADAQTGQTILDALFFGEGTAPAARAEKILDAARRELSHNRGNGGKIFALKQELRAIDEACLAAQDAAQKRRSLRTEIANLREQLLKIEAQERHVEQMEEAARLDAELSRYDAWHAAEAECERFCLHYRREREDPASVMHYVQGQGGAARILQKARRLARKKQILAPVSAFFGVASAVLAVVAWLIHALWWPVAALALFASLMAAVICHRSSRRLQGIYTRLGVHSPSMLRTALACLEDDLPRRIENAKSAATALGNGLEPEREAALRVRRAPLPDPTADLLALSEQRAQLHCKGAALSERLAAAEREELVLLAGAKDPEALQAERAGLERQLEVAEKRLLAIQMAGEALREAGRELRDSIIPRLLARACDVFSALTGGKWSTLYISERFSVSVGTPTGAVPLSHFSAGCRDSAYLSLRLALTELLTDEPLPLLFDEVTARLDDARLARFLLLLDRFCAGGRQCLLFTCHTREAAMTSEKNITHIVL